MQGRYPPLFLSVIILPGKFTGKGPERPTHQGLMSEVSGSAEAGTGGAAQRPAAPHLARGYESGRRLYECESSLLTRSLQSSACAGRHEDHGTEPDPRGELPTTGAPTDARDAAQGETGRGRVELAETEAAAHEAAGDARPHAASTSSVAAPMPPRDPAGQGHEHRSQCEDGTLGVILLVDTADTLAGPGQCGPSLGTAETEMVSDWLSQSKMYVGGGPASHISAKEVQSMGTRKECLLHHIGKRCTICG